MEVKHRQILRDNMVDLVGNMVPEPLMPHLIQRQVFTDYMVDSIKAEKARHKQVVKILGMLTKRGPDAFDKFYLSLVDTHQDYLARKLKPGLDPSAIRRPRPTIGSMSRHQLINIKRVQRTAGLLDFKVKAAVEPQYGDCIYPMLSRPRGQALIINNRTFWDNSGLTERYGTNVDGDNLKCLLEQLEYEVTQATDLTAEQIKHTIQTFSRREKHVRCDSTIVAVLSHGTEGGAVLGVDGQPVNVDFIIQRFTARSCPSLRSKPKIFIIQACRGKFRDRGSVEDGPVGKDSVDGDETDFVMDVD